jgi:opacity protein-like surface antigen
MRKAAVEAEALAAAASAAALAAAASAAALAAQHAAADARRRLFISAFIATAQNGFGLDLDHALHLCRETWGEEDLFNAVIDLPHGAVKLKNPDCTSVVGARRGWRRGKRRWRRARAGN